MGQYTEQLINAGATIGGGALGGIMGMIAGKQNDQRQIEMQRKLQDMQIQGQIQMTDYNMKKQMEMWEATNYKAQMAQMKKAGLNPALLYGMGGGGGSTTGIQPGSVSGGNAPAGGGELMGGIGMGLQTAMQAAQIRNIEAQTKKTEAEIPNISKTGANIDADTELKKMNWNLAAIQEKIQGDTQNAVVAKALTELRTITAEMHIREQQQKITAETADEVIKKAGLDVAIAATENELKKAQKKATEKGIEKADEEIQKIRTEIQNMKDYYQLDNFIEREKVRLIDKGINVAIITSVLGGIMNLATGGRR